MIKTSTKFEQIQKDFEKKLIKFDTNLQFSSSNRGVEEETSIIYLNNMNELHFIMDEESQTP